MQYTITLTDGSSFETDIPTRIGALATELNKAGFMVVVKDGKRIIINVPQIVSVEEV